jgi:hypothetical protein
LTPRTSYPSDLVKVLIDALFDRPGPEPVRSELAAAGLQVLELWEDAVSFRYDTAEKALEHLLKSAAGTAFYEAIDPLRRSALTGRFLELLTARHPLGRDYEVRHEYLACIASKPPGFV